MASEIRFAHLSDWHSTTLEGAGRALLHPKRLSGWASWRWSRRHRHDVGILEAAFRDVQEQDVDCILVTGDLTHVSLAEEFRSAARQLTALGPPERVFLIPGNHDRYVRIEREISWDLWAAYLRGSATSDLDASLAECLVDQPEDLIAPDHADYPTLRIFGSLAVIGLCSAIPTPVFRAGGRLGALQLERLERLLARTRALGLCRVVMIHHPIAVSSEPVRRALRDAEGLRNVLAREGAELVLHGHKHRRRVGHVPGPNGPIPVIGVPSASEVGSRPEKMAQYHVYAVRRSEEASSGFRIEAGVRGYDAAAGGFREVDSKLL
ncbi:MAG: metallophosphoesterase family protein [bacterium]